MPDWPSGLQGSRAETIGALTASSRGTLITASGTVNTKGSYAELEDSTLFDADGFMLCISRHSNALTDFLIDVAVGAAGSEQIIVPDIQWSGGSAVEAGGMSELFPIPIKASSRVAVRCQSNGASVTFDLSMLLFAGGFFQSLRMGRATTYGANTADSGGTSIAWSGTANTKGSWVELSSAVSNPVYGFVLCVGSQITSISTEIFSLIDIGVGAAGSEVVIAGDLPVNGATVTDVFMPIWRYVPASVKSGERLAARMQSSANRNLDVTVVGFD